MSNWQTIKVNKSWPDIAPKWQRNVPIERSYPSVALIVNGTIVAPLLVVVGDGKLIWVLGPLDVFDKLMADTSVKKRKLDLAGIWAVVTDPWCPAVPVPTELEVVDSRGFDPLIAVKKPDGGGPLPPDIIKEPKTAPAAVPRQEPVAVAAIVVLFTSSA